MGHKAGIGAIFGIVSEEGVAKPNSPVVLLDRSNHRVVRKQWTREDGGFTFNGLNEQEATYIAYATDEDGEVPKNALIQDRILPVPAYSGATLWANWQYTARRDGAMFAWSGRYYQEEPSSLMLPYDSLSAFSRPGHDAPANLLGGSASTALASAPVVEGAPHIPVVELTQGHLFYAAPICPYNLRVGANRVAEHSMEVTLDLLNCEGPISVAASPGQVRPTLHAAWFLDDGDSTRRPHWYSQLRYTPSTRTLSVVYRNSTGVAPDTSWSSGVQTGTLVTRSHTFNEGEVPEGLVHIAYSFDPGVRLALFVNGTLVEDWSLLGESTTLPYSHRTHGSDLYGWLDGMFIFAGPATANSPNHATKVRFGPFAFYPYTLLTDEQIIEHAAAIVEPDVLPKLTGYVKEVIMDDPTVYARLDDLETDVVNQSHTQLEFLRATLSFARPTTHLRFLQQDPGAIELEQPSPVTGGMSTRFFGGYLRGRSMFRTFPVRRTGSVEFFIEPSETPHSEERILRLAAGATRMFWVHMDADRKLTCGFRTEAATEEDHTFDYALPHDVFTHVVITLDISETEMKLYIDGSLEETASVTGTLMAQGQHATSADTDANVWIAGSAAGNTTFKGHLCEVAIYGHALPASRVSEHYNARNIP